MKFIVQLLLILVKYSFLDTVNTQSLKPESKIVGGHEARPHSHPYLVSLQTRFLWVRVHSCGGAILNERWILSAAHCAVESWLTRWLPLEAVVGIHDIDNFGTQSQVLKISERIHHPLYEGGIGPYDIAVFSTETPILFTKWVQPVKLPIIYKFGEGQMKLAGWGVLKTTYFIPDLPNTLQEVTVTYIPYDECYAAIDNMKESYEANPLDKYANMCTGPTTGGVAACNGDSGGPLIQYVPKAILVPNDPVEDNTEKYDANNYECCNEQVTETIEDATSSPIEDATSSPMEEDTSSPTPQERQYEEELVPVVIGVVSWGVSPCGEIGAPTIYTNVSTYLDFINYNIRDV